MKKNSNDGMFDASVEIPMPEVYFRKMGIGSRATFFRWEKAGLRIVRVGGRRFVYRSDLRRFLEGMDHEAGEDKITLRKAPPTKGTNGIK